MNKIRILLTICVVVLTAGAGQSQGIAGKVKEFQTNRALAYVHVQAMNLASGDISGGLTDQEGKVSIQGLATGNYRISASCLGYYPVQQEVQVSANNLSEVNLELKPAMIPLGEVQVSSLRYEKLEREIAMPITVIPRENFPRQSSMTLSDVLANEPGIALVRDGGWGTSVNIRGLGESRLVALVDGNRIETASDLVAGLSMFDVNEIERVEVIKGAASSIFGTGAMGGVINILIDKGKYYSKPTIHGTATGIFEGVNKLFGTHVAVETGAKAWKVRLSGGYRTAGDYSTPEGIVENSQFNDRNLNATIGVKPFKNHELEINGQHYQALDAGIPGGAPFGPAATATYPEEKRQLVSAKYTVRDLLPSMSEISVRAYHQYILRDVEMIPNTPPSMVGTSRITALKVLPRGEHNTSGMVLETKWKTGETGQLVAGIDLWQRRLETSRQKFIKQEILDAFMMPIKIMDVIRTEEPNPDSRFGSMGIFAQKEKKFLDDKLELTFGGRVDLIRVANDQALDPVGIMIDGVVKDPVPNQRITFNADTVRAFSWSANASAIYHLIKNLDITANMGRSFRSPSLEERFKYIDLGSKVRLGDPNLKPEKGLFGDLGLRIWMDRFQLQANGFVNYMTDMIVETPGVFIYELNTGPQAGLTDTLPALVNANVNKALLAGFDASVNYQALRNLVVFSKASFVRGMNLTQDNALPQIPPVMVGGGFRYQLPGIFTIEWTSTWAAAQRKIAPGEKETDGYFLSDVALYSAQKELGIASFQLFAGVDNLFNASYRNHLATNRGMVVAEPGRNVFVKVVMRF
jgi:hemoglobin/transferrin/lactoferrin receptor protein